MKDALIVVLATESNKKRLETFFKYCLVNKTKNVDCHILLGPDRNEGFAEKLLQESPIPNITTTIKRYPTDDAAYKRMNGYHDINQETIDNYRWHISIDEDSVTDLDGLLTALDENFDNNNCAYVSGETMNNYQSEEVVIAEALGKSHWYKNYGPFHEWEISCLNQKTMQTIVENPIAKKVLKLRMKMQSGWGDHCLGLALRFCKIYPIQTTYITATNRILEHSLLGKHYYHVHHIYEKTNFGDPIGMHHILPVLHMPNNPEKKTAWLTIIDNGLEREVGIINLNIDKSISTKREPNRNFGLCSMKDGNVFVHLPEEKEPLLLRLNETITGVCTKWELFD